MCLAHGPFDGVAVCPACVPICERAADAIVDVDLQVLHRLAVRDRRRRAWIGALLAALGLVATWWMMR